jgi:hypothetical protein
MKTRLLSIGFLIIALGLAYYFVSRIKFAIDEEKRIESSEAAVIAKLKLIREAELAYQEIHSRYTDNWDTLINFVKYGQYPITKRSETIIEKPYGGDSIIVNIDTLEIIPVKQYMFIKEHNVYAADDGIFQAFLVEEGDYVIKGQKIYRMVSATTGKVVDQIAKQTGRVKELPPRAANSPLVKAEILFILVEEKFDPNTNIDELAIIPLTNPPLKFDLFADRINKNNLLVNVIEVRDIAPVNPKRKEDNEANNRKPLRFGSRSEVTTAGNWE